ncbi:hypothetical protein CBM2609_B30248 [Cupriavidus taiwanensis]|uniref:uracil-DNA glycosylase family protein n=1 Tax=Cupriavidus taiwanensis TaxID=164546 RepID=UPI000E162EF8|nr:uracil-DNA glycosylase family protein [Cupriavidus taiwanensis]SOZ19371.1 hypothetical protein CBM2604_B40246 [Cupriavidus taiwanensis]SOZ32567.1 hypothetical protein CBM2609_B30248 [Cupriavidus taiwanensis]SOZ48164.1 hypothetical protein CBM2610_B30246 [Cupriavidus taiwanensis]
MGTTTVYDGSRIWVGERYPRHRTFVLGLSYYGVWDGDKETDEVYVGKYVADEIEDRLYSKLDRSVGLCRRDFWQQIAFTNMVIGSVGIQSDSKTSDDRVRAGMPRLRDLLVKYEPERVWLLGKQLERYAGHVCGDLGIPFVTIAHPTGLNNRRRPVTPNEIKASWDHLQSLHRGGIATPGGHQLDAADLRVSTTAHWEAEQTPSANPDSGTQRFPSTSSRSQDGNERKWKALGFGHKTSDPTTWRYWSEQAGKGPWRIASPFDIAVYRQVGRQLFLDDLLILEGATQWDATWQALAHFYSQVVPRLAAPPLSDRSPASGSNQ